MKDEHGWWVWKKPLLDAKNIQMLNEVILNNYEFEEDKTKGATDKEGNYLKNIKPKVISLKFLPTLFSQDILSMAFHVAHYNFGLVTFPPNIWDALLYNVYSGDINGKYGEHDDTSRSWTYDTKMTFLLNLSEEPYEGGDFIIDNQTQDFFRVPGTAILFKSSMKHQVTPVIKGKRISLAHFINGPKFR